MSDLVEIQIPFSGFYNSVHDSEIDREIESGFNYDYETGEDIELTDETRDAIWSADVDHQAIELEYCAAFVEAFGDKYGLTLEFVEMTSPREYNFSTDRIFAKIPRKQMNKIRKEVEANEKWPQYIKDNFTSYDGYWANYSSNYKDKDWTGDDLDECQYGTILKFWININPETSSEGWSMEEWYLTNDFEMCNWDSINKAHEVISKYIKEVKNE